MYYKYPRTFHLPWSEGINSDDKVIDSLEPFEGMKVIVTEKLDGENTTMYRDHIHARSIDSPSNFTRNWVKNLHASIQYYIPAGYRIVGENMWAEHSIRYENLESYFYAFAVYDDNNWCLSWHDTEDFLSELPVYIPTPKVLYHGMFDETKVRAIHIRNMEGYVVRNAGQFHYDDFSKNVVKNVRRDHVQTDKHWLQSVRQNGILVER